MTGRPEWHEPPATPADEHRQRLIEQHADRGYSDERTRLNRDAPPAWATSLLVGLVLPPACEERGAA